MLFELENARLIPTIGLLFACHLVACSGDPGGAEAGDASDIADAGIDLSLETDIPFDGGVDDLMDVDVETGQLHPCVEAPMFPPDGTVSGTINPTAGDAFHYRFEADKGEFIALTASSQTEFMTPGNDLVVSVLTEDGLRVIASWDDDQLGHGGSGVLNTLIAKEGVYCARIEHVSSWAGVPSLPTSALEYSLYLERDPEGRFDEDAEPNDTIEEAQTLEYGGEASLAVLGKLEGAQDVDVFRIPAAPGGFTEILVPSSGPGGPGVNGNGSTLELGRVELLDAEGHVLARSEPRSGPRWLWAQYDAGQDLFLTFERRPGSAPGDNDFYFATGLMGVISTEAELHAGENDSLATAEAMFGGEDYEVSFLQFYSSGNIHVAPEGAPVDVDFFSFPVEGVEELEVFCFSNVGASGVVNPRFAIVDATGQVLREGVESAQQPVVWGYHYNAIEPPLILPEAGQYYLRVTADGQLPDVASRFYFCKLYTWPG